MAAAGKSLGELRTCSWSLLASARRSARASVSARAALAAAAADASSAARLRLQAGKGIRMWSLQAIVHCQYARKHGFLCTSVHCCLITIHQAIELAGWQAAAGQGCGADAASNPRPDHHKSPEVIMQWSGTHLSTSPAFPIAAVVADAGGAPPAACACAACCMAFSSASLRASSRAALILAAMAWSMVTCGHAACTPKLSAGACTCRHERSVAMSRGSLCGNSQTYLHNLDRKCNAIAKGHGPA